MEKLRMLWTGSAMVTKCYNTCFTISNNEESEYFLVDAGGGNTILSNLEKVDISINNIHNVFISHNHNDHILGVIWIIRAACNNMLKSKYEGNLNIYAHKLSLDAIRSISSFVLQKKFLNLFDTRVIFNEIHHNYTTKILERDITFFDINSTKDLQHGFKLKLQNNKTLTFLGDEPYREGVKDFCVNVDYLLHEAFCSYADREIFKPYEKHHATAKDACANAALLNAKSILLYHAEDKNLSTRKERYINEGKEVFSGNIFVPNDLDEIIL